MEKIKKFILPAHTNNLYENEAISSISLTKEIANTINELVEAYNGLIDIDLEREQLQNGKINKAIVYIKDNLLNTLEELTALYEKNGFFNTTIQKYTAELETRLNNLISSISAGTTTLDAELIDIRTGANGIIYSTAGNSIRENIKNMLVFAEQLNEYIKSNMIIDSVHQLNLESTTAQCIGTGGITTNIDSGDTNFVVSKYFDVIAGESYIITGSAMINQYIYCFYDENNVFVKGLKASTENQHNVNQNYGYVDSELVMIPAGAYKMRIAGNTGVVSPELKKVTSSSRHDTGTFNWLKNLSNLIANNSFEYDTPIESAYTEKSVIERNGAFTPSELLSQNYLVSDLIEVNAGEVYHLTGSAHYAKGLYALYDANEKFVIGEITEDISTVTILNKNIIIPYGVKYIRVACMRDYNLFEIKKAISFKNKAGGIDWSNIKWACLGDSLTEVNSRTSKRYYEFVQDKTGVNVVNMGSSGTGYKRSEEQSKAFYQRALNMPADCDIVTIFGSGNDNPYFNNIGSPTDTGTNTLCGCINKTIDNLYSVNPLVKIGIVSPTAWIDNQPTDNTRFKDYATALKEICELRSIPFLDLYHLSGFRPNELSYRELVFSNDDGNGVHPNEEGHKIISSHFYNFLISLIGTY